MVIVKTEWLVTEPSGDSQNLKADGQINTDDGQLGGRLTKHDAVRSVEV